MPVSSGHLSPSRILESDGEPIFPSQRKNQRQQILERLLAACGGEVPSPELAKVSLQYNARILELREAGFVIISRIEIRSGVKHGSFRLYRCPGSQTDAGGVE